MDIERLKAIPFKYLTSIYNHTQPNTKLFLTYSGINSYYTFHKVVKIIGFVYPGGIPERAPNGIQLLYGNGGEVRYLDYYAAYLLPDYPSPWWNLRYIIE